MPNHAGGAPVAGSGPLFGLNNLNNQRATASFGDL